MRDVLITFCASYTIIFVALLAVVAFFRLGHGRRSSYVVLLVSAGVLGFVLQLLAAHMHYEPRPFVAEHIRPIIRHGTDNGFPSDHALVTMLLTAATYLFSRKIAGFMLVGTLLTAIGRVLAYLHSPQQIAAGWAIAIVSVIVARLCMNALRLPNRVKHST